MERLGLLTLYKRVAAELHVRTFSDLVCSTRKLDSEPWDRKPHDPTTIPQPVRKVVYFGPFGPAALAFARSCRESGIETYLLTPDIHKQNSGRDLDQVPLFAGAARLDAALEETAEGIRRVVQYVRTVGAQALTAQSDSHCLWLARSARHFPESCRILLPQVSSLEMLASKERQLALARAAQLEVLPTFLVRTVADIPRIPAEMYPICLRPTSPKAVAPSFRVLKADTPSDLGRLMQSLHSLDEAILAQPFRVSPNLIVHCARHHTSGELFALHAFLVDRKFEGFALRMKPIPMPAGMREKIQEFSGLANLSGVYHFDFLYDSEKGSAYFLEVNARFGGTTDKVVRMGVDEPFHCLSAYDVFSDQKQPPNRRNCNSVVNKRAVLKHLVTMLRRNPEPWDFPLEHRAKGALRSMGDLLLTNDSVFCWRDLPGSWQFHLRKPDYVLKLFKRWL